MNGIKPKSKKQLAGQFYTTRCDYILDGLPLPQYRESKEYARKRIPFDLAYRIVQHLMM